MSALLSLWLFADKEKEQAVGGPVGTLSKRDGKKCQRQACDADTLTLEHTGPVQTGLLELT